MRRALSVGFLLLAVGFASAQAGLPSAKRLQAIELVKEAAACFGRGDMSLVLKICRQAITLDPTYPRAYTWLGAAYQRNGDKANACNAFARVIKLAPNTPDATRSLRGLRELGCALPAGPSPSRTDNSRSPSVKSGARLENHWQATAGVASLAFSPDGTFLSGGGSDGAWRLWRVPDGRLQRLERGAGYEIGAVACSADAYALGTGEGKIRFFHVLDNGEGPAIESRSGAVSGLSFGAKGRFLAAAGPENSLKIFETRSQALLFQIPGDGFSLSGVAFSPDGRFLAVGVGSMMRIYETQRGRLIRTLTGDGLPVNAVAWSRNGELIAGAIGYKIRVWNAQTGALKHILSGHRLTVTTLAFGTGTTLISGGYDAQLRLWNARTGVNRATLNFHTTQIRGVAFDNSGQRLASADQNGMVGLWNLNR